MLLPRIMFASMPSPIEGESHHMTPPSSPSSAQLPENAAVTPVSAADACSICLEAIQSEVAFRSSCGHIYHKDCLSHWRAMHHNQCPLCRAALPRGYGLTPENYSSPPPRPSLQDQEQRQQVATAAQRVRRSMEMRRAMEQQQRLQLERASSSSSSSLAIQPCR